MEIFPYWVETKDGNHIIWTKLDLPPLSSVVIYLHKFDGTGQMYTPNDIFIFYEDFSNNKTYSDFVHVNWYSTHGDCKVEDEKLKISNYEACIFTKDIELTDFILDVDVYYPGNRRVEIGIGHFSDDYKTRDDGMSFHYDISDTGWKIFGYDNYNGTHDDVNGWIKLRCIATKDYAKIVNRETGKVYCTASNRLTNPLKLYKVFVYHWHPDTAMFDNIKIRKYADIEPEVSIEKLNYDTWKVTITNKNDYYLYDYQVQIDGNDIVSDGKCDLLLTSEPYRIITVEYTSLFLREGYAVIKDLNKYSTMIRYIISFSKMSGDSHICSIGSHNIYSKDSKLYIDNTELEYKDDNQITIDIIKNSLVKININNDFVSSLPFDEVKIGDNVDVHVKVMSFVK